MKQISVLIENEAGAMAAVTQLLADNKVNMKALCIADSVEYGILRIVTDEVDVALKALTDKGIHQGGFAYVRISDYIYESGAMHVIR